MLLPLKKAFLHQPGWLAALLSLLWLVATPQTLRAAVDQTLLSRTYTSGPDVRQREINAILQSRDGYVWIGTQKGLLRFDGVTLTAFTTENTTAIAGDDFDAFSMWEAKDGSLWFGTGTAGVVRNDHGVFSTVGPAQGLPGPAVSRLDGDSEGDIWIYNNDRVSRWRRGQLEWMHPERFSSSVGRMIAHADRRTEDFDGMGLWRRTRRGVERFAFGEWKPFPTPVGESRPFEDDVARIYEDNLHRVWYRVFSQPGRYFCVQGNSLRSFDGLPPNALVSYQDTSGFLWLNTPDSHQARWKGGKLFPLPQMHTPSYLRVLEEPDGTFVVGSHRTPLFEFRPKLVYTIPITGTLEEEPVLYRQSGGEVWVGGTELARASLDGREPTLVPVNVKQKRGDQILALSEDAQRRLIIATQNHRTLLDLDGGKLRPLATRDLGDSKVQALLLSSSGDQWVGTHNGLYRYRSASKEPTERVWSGDVSCLFEGPANQILFGTDNGVLRLNNVLPHPAVTPVWSGDAVLAIEADRSGEVWLSTWKTGIVHLGEAGPQSFGTSAGLPTNRVYSITFDEGGDLWLRSDLGLLRVRRKSLDGNSTDAAAKLQVMVLGQNDGLPISVMGKAGDAGALRLPGGLLWFSTSAGIVSLRPADFLTGGTRPAPVLEEHSVDQSPRLGGRDIMLLPGQGDLELHYTALRSRRPEDVRFRYRLVGFDTTWILAGSRRTAYYTHLPPGSYDFQVEATEGDGEDWVSSDSAAHVTVQAPLYRTWWARMLATGALLTLIVYMVRRSRRAVLEKSRVRQAFTHQLITAQEQERKRLAGELHDSVGQQLAVIYSSASALITTENDGRTSLRLAAIAAQAADALREVKQLSYDLRPYQLDRIGLTKAIADLLRRLRAGANVTVVEEIDEVDGFFTPEHEINVYRIIQESVSNALRHAHPSRISVFLWRDGDSLRIVVEDDGSGFLAEGQQAMPGLGLIGIRERADVLGGRAKITSTPGHGTRVEVDVPRGLHV